MVILCQLTLQHIVNSCNQGFLINGPVLQALGSLSSLLLAFSEFFNFLIKNSQFLGTVKDAWESNWFYGCKMYILVMKLKALKSILKRL